MEYEVTKSDTPSNLGQSVSIVLHHSNVDNPALRGINSVFVDTCISGAEFKASDIQNYIDFAIGRFSNYVDDIGTKYTWFTITVFIIDPKRASCEVVWTKMHIKDTKRTVIAPKKRFATIKPTFIEQDIHDLLNAAITTSPTSVPDNNW
jgi:hypothetical protein